MASISRLRRLTRSPFRLGIALMAAAAVVTLLGFYKDQIIVGIKPTSTVTVHFAENYGLVEYKTPVKVGGIEAGVVTDVTEGPDGGAVAEVELDDDIPKTLRSKPSARIRPATLLGGNYYVDLVPGGSPGSFDGRIPASRTTLPVEMDKITRALQPDVLKSLRNDVGHLDRTLAEPGRSALKDLLRSAPDTLEPAADVLRAARGTRPATDLTDVATGLRNTAAVLTRRHGQLDATVRYLNATSTALGRRSTELGTTLAELPATLDATDTGLRKLNKTLGKLRSTAGPLRPSARALNDAIRELDPALVAARPMMTDLRHVLDDAQPIVDGLVPATRQATGVFTDIRGPVLERLNGPVKHTVLAPWKGQKGTLYQGGGADWPTYQALAYMVTNMNRMAMNTTPDGAIITYGVGASGGSLGGLPVSLEQLIGELTGIGEKGPR